MSDAKKREPLSIETGRERPSIKIDGVLYPLVCPEDLEIEQALWLERTAPKMNRLTKKLHEGAYDESIAKEVGHDLIKFSDIILGEVPKEVCNRLKPMHRLAIINAYMEVAKSPSFFDQVQVDGKVSSQDSSASTEVLSENGGD